MTGTPHPSPGFQASKSPYRGMAHPHRLPRATAAPVVALLALAASCLPSDDCQGGSHQLVLQQFHDGAATPWQDFEFFRNVCQPMLCDPWDPACPGAPYNETFTVNSQGSERDRYMFFQACPDGCTESPFFAPTGTYRVGGAYRSVSGLGASTREVPFSRYRQVGHVRYYDRGACSYEIPDLTELLDRLVSQIRSFILDDWHIYDVTVNNRSLRTVLGSPDCDQQQSYFAENHDYINVRLRLRVKPLAVGYWYHDIDTWWRFIAHPRSQRLYCSDGRHADLTPPCTTDSDCTSAGFGTPADYCADGRCRRHCWLGDDSLCAGLPNAPTCGIGEYRSFCSLGPYCSTHDDCAEYPGSYCAPPGYEDWAGTCHKPCEQNSDCSVYGSNSRCMEPTLTQICQLPSGCQTLSCDPNHDECDTWIPGAKCQSTKEGFVCQKRSFLDVADYGIQNSYERHCQGDYVFCKAIYNGYRKKVNDYTKNLYPLLAQVIHEMYETTWQEMTDRNGDLVPCADGDDPLFNCKFLAGLGDVQNFELRCGPETGNCELRPFYVYGVNMYPAAMEAILAPTDDSDQYPEYTALSTTEFCDSDAPNISAFWGPVKVEWWQ